MVVCTSTQVVADQEQYNAIAYYRLSKDDGSKRESDSISNQRKLVHAFLDNNKHIRLVDEKYDDGYTGTNYDRPGFRAVMEAVQAGLVNCIIVKDLSRLGREYIETGKYLEMIFPALGVRFIAINDDIDSEHSNPGDDIIIPVKNIMNEAYCRELSRKLRRQFRIQRSNGEFLGAFATYGYCKSPDDKHKLVIDEYAAEVVKGIFVLKSKGYSQQAIADYLNGQQILSPAEYKKSLGLKYKTGFKVSETAKWSAVTVRRILVNPIYVGTLTQGIRGTPNYKIRQIRQRNADDWVTVENSHEKIIDPLLFSTVQRMLERDTRTAPGEDTVYPLAGVLYCADCERLMSRRSVTRGKKKFMYYVCSTYKLEKGCSNHSVEREKLEAIVLRAIRNQIDVIAELEQVISNTAENEVYGAGIKRIDMMIAQKNKDIDSYSDFRMKLYEALCDDLIDREEYNRMRLSYTEKIECAQAAVNELVSQREELLNGGQADRQWIEVFMRFRDENALTREMVVALIDQILVYEDKRIRILFNYRDELEYLQLTMKQTIQEVG